MATRVTDGAGALLSLNLKKKRDCSQSKTLLVARATWRKFIDPEAFMNYVVSELC